MSGFRKSSNKLSETVNLKNVSATSPVFQEIVQNGNRDLVFICDGGVTLAFHSEIVANLSSLVRNILKLEESGPSRFYTPKNSQIFITLAEVNPITLRIVMDSLYSRDVINFSSFNSVGIQSIVKNLGVSEELFNVTVSNEHGQNADNVNDDTIVDVISDLMEEFSANPQQSEKDLQEMIANNLGDGFLTKIGESSTIGDDDFFGLENLMAEPGDDDLEFDPATVEETVSANDVEDKLNVSFQDDADIPDIQTSYGNDALNDTATKKCFVEMSNIPNETLKHYISIAQDSLVRSVKRRPDEESDINRRKRRKNLSQDYEYDNLDESVTSENVSILEEVIENAPKIQVAPTPNQVKPPPPGPPPPTPVSIVPGPPISASVPEVVDNTEVQFVEAKQVSCMICDEVFKVRSKIIQHLCCSHFSNQIFALYPFVKGASCPVCVKTGKAKVIILKDKNSHVRHIGQVHEIIFDIITPEFKETIDQFAKTSKKAPPPKYRVKEEKADVTASVEESNSSFQESPEDNYMKLLKDFTENYEVPNLTEKSHSEVSDSSFNTTVEERVNDDSVFSQSDQSLLEKYCIEVDNTNLAAETPESTSVACSLCPDLVTFKYRPHILTHLSYQHLSRELLSLYQFEEGKPCEICSEEGKQASISPSSQDYANHIGSFHEKVLDLLPTDFCSRIDEMPRNKQKEESPSELETSSFNPDLNSTFLEKDMDVVVVKAAVSRADSDCDICYQTGVPSRADLILHYATKHFQQQILKSYPFQESMPCKACVETRNPKAFVAKNAFRHLKHIGVMHEKALNFMSSPAVTKMESKFLIKKKPNNFSPEAFGASILKNVTNSPAVFSCKLCVKSFSSENELTVHKNSHKEGRNYNCRYCGKTSDNAKQFKHHLLSHKNDLSKAKLA